MNKKGILVIIYTSIIVLGAVYFNYTSLSANVSEEKTSPSIVSDNLRQAAIPNDFYQEINLGENYTYNVTGFGLDTKWSDFAGNPEVDWKTDSGNQILVNFTGFYNRDPNDPGDSFPDTDMPWMNISIFEDKSGPSLNYTNANVSNSEVARNLKLGFSGFQSGFLIKVNHTDWLKANATLEANGASGPKAHLTKEETYNFLYFRFEQYGSVENQETELIYDKISGLLVWAKTINGSYNLEIFLEDYALSFDKVYEYDMVEFKGPGQWWSLSWEFLGLFISSSDDPLNVNFNGYYGKDPSDSGGDVFTDPNLKRAWLNVSFFWQGDFAPVPSLQVKNCSNREAASSMMLGYFDFQTGFLIPYMNETYLKEKALEQTDVSGELANVYIKESDLTIKFTFQQTFSSWGSNHQYTSLIYEKRTGLLLWAHTQFSDYEIKLTLDGYEPQNVGLLPATADDDDDKDGGKKQAIPSFILIVIFSMVIISSSILVLKMRRKIA